MDRVLHNARVLTMDPATPVAEALALAGARVAAVGATAALLAQRDRRTVLHDVGGRTIVPGFVDAHTHFAMAALDSVSVDLAGVPVADIPALQERVRAAARATPPGGWIRVGPYDERALREGRHPTRAELDEAAPGHPVLLVHWSYHRAVVNSRALASVGFGGAAVPGGIVHRDAAGTPTGLLTEAATGRPQARTTEALLERYAAAGTDPVALVEAHARRYLTLGITSLHDAFLLPAFYRLVVRAAAAGRLPLYVTPLRADPDWLDPVSVWLERGRRGAGGTDDDLDPDAPRPPRLRRGGLKFLAHGVYEGLVFYTQADLDELVARVVRRDLSVAIHATHGAGIDLALGAAAHARRAGAHPRSRVRLEHFFRGTDADIARARGAGVAVVTQPAAVWAMGDQWLAGGAAPGVHRFPIGQLLAAGVRVAGGSDAPCFPLPPLQGIAAAVGRRTRAGAQLDADQAVTVEEALRLYTLGAAWAGGAEDEEGSLTPGKLANFVVLSGDLCATPPEDLAGLTVDETWVDGALAYQRDGAPRPPADHGRAAGPHEPPTR